MMNTVSAATVARILLLTMGCESVRHVKSALAGSAGQQEDFRDAAFHDEDYRSSQMRM